MNPGMSEAAVREVSPINSRSPLMAATAVQALCNITKKKLLTATIQERPVPDSNFELSAWCKSIASFPGFLLLHWSPMTIYIEAY
jgi:hypothetical protein